MNKDTKSVLFLLLVGLLLGGLFGAIDAGAKGKEDNGHVLESITSGQLVTSSVWKPMSITPSFNISAFKDDGYAKWVPPQWWKDVVKQGKPRPVFAVPGKTKDGLDTVEFRSLTDDEGGTK